jgi:hypothetical protein
MNPREISLLQQKRTKFCEYIKEQHRLPKKLRESSKLEEAKRKMETLNRWLKNS